MAIFYSYIILFSSKTLVSTLKGIQITDKILKFFDIRSDSSRIRIQDFKNRIREKLSGLYSQHWFLQYTITILCCLPCHGTAASPP